MNSYPIFKEAPGLVAKFMAMGLVHPPDPSTLATAKDYNPASYDPKKRREKYQCRYCAGVGKHSKTCKRP